MSIGRVLWVPFLSYLLVDIWICQCMLGLQNVFIIWFYYKQHRPMLKNEVKKTTTRPPRPSARQAGPKWTTHSASVKLCIKEILEYKQTANKPPSSHSARSPCMFRFFINNGVIAIAWLQTRLLNMGFLVLHVDKNKLWFAEHRDIHILYFKVCFVNACLCLCVRERQKGEKWRHRDIKGFNFI